MTKVSHKNKILYLAEVDPVLGAVIQKLPPLQPRSRDLPEAYFRSLVVAIINQQLSGKAADTIFKRFEALFKRVPTPQQVLQMPAAKMRTAGLSGMKVAFLKDLSKKIIDKTLNMKEIDSWSDEDIIDHLTQVKGIGRWTAEMFLMFSLGRDDVFSYGDLALRNAMQRLYRLRTVPTPAQAVKISAVWKPYRTLASRYLWASLETE